MTDRCNQERVDEPFGVRDLERHSVEPRAPTALGGEEFFENLQIAEAGWVRGDLLSEKYRTMKRQYPLGPDVYGDHVPALWMVTAVELWFRAAFGAVGVEVDVYYAGKAFVLTGTLARMTRGEATNRPSPARAAATSTTRGGFSITSATPGVMSRWRNAFDITPQTKVSLSPSRRNSNVIPTSGGSSAHQMFGVTPR